MEAVSPDARETDSSRKVRHRENALFQEDIANPT